MLRQRDCAGVACDVGSAGYYSAVALVLLTMLVPSASAMPDLKIIKIENRGPELQQKTVTYIREDRRRVEERREYLSPPPGGPVVFPAIVTITRCDLNQMFVLNLDDREYMSMPVPKPPTLQEVEAFVAQHPAPAVPPQPTLLIETTTQDTGERQELFGYTARHVVTTVKQIPLVQSLQKSQEDATDGWYVDLDTRISCDPRTKGRLMAFSGTPEPPVLTFKNIGKEETGFALFTKGSGNEMRVTELSTEPPDSALFEVPTDFREVTQIRRAPR
jgi:hypothetical protein